MSLVATPPIAAARRATDSLGCVAKRLATDQELDGPGIRFYRKRADDGVPSQVTTDASGRGFLVGVAMSGGHRRRIFQGRHASSHAFDSGAIYVRDFADDYRAELDGRFDFLLIEIPRAAFERAVDERVGTRITGLECVTGLPDPVLAHLARALAPALARPREASTLFIDQMGVVIRTHLIEQYGGAVSSAPPARRTGRLSRLLEARAKELLRSRIDGTLTIGDVAEACRLSRGHFIRAFCATTGQTPHQWLQAQRIEVARGLLRGSTLPLAEIAAVCGFADQSHFTRVFAQVVGQPPGAWRRQR